MSSKPTTIFSCHQKCYGTRSMRVYVFKTHHNFQFSPQMLQNQIDEGLCLQNPPQCSILHHKCYITKSMRVNVFKTHHNLQFSPQMIQNQIDESLCLQNPPESSVFTTNATEPDRCESISSKPTTIFNFHHKCYITISMKVYVFKTHTIVSFHHKCYRTRSMRV